MTPEREELEKDFFIKTVSGFRMKTRKTEQKPILNSPILNSPNNLEQRGKLLKKISRYPDLLSRSPNLTPTPAILKPIPVFTKRKMRKA